MIQTPTLFEMSGVLWVYTAAMLAGHSLDAEAWHEWFKRRRRK